MATEQPSRRSFLTTVGVGVVGGTVGVGQSAATPGRDEYIVAADDDVTLSYLEEQVKTLHPEVDLVDRDEVLEFTLASVPASDETAFKADVSGLTRYVERNGRMEALDGAAVASEPSDPRFERQWAPQEVNAPTAWETTEAAGVTVAVVDTGVDYEHPDLSARFGATKGYDFVDGDDDPMDGNGHGTHVAGIAAGTTDNDTGIAGVSNAQLLGVRVLDDSGRGSYSDIAQGIRWAADNGADVINLSLGPPGCTGDVSATIEDAIEYAHGEGALVVAAAGNDSCSEIDGPARVDESVAVTALARDGDLASFSNYGDRADVTAPGVDVLSTYLGGYRRLDGTSMASPVVAGVAALALASDASLGPDALKQRVRDGAVDIGLADEKQGAGRVDASNVVDPGNEPPTAAIDAETTTPTIDEAVAFDGTGSSDPDGSIATYEWTFGDGTTATGAAVEHAYDATGEYTVGLTVTDDDGAIGTATTTVTVEPPNEPPTADIDAPGDPLVVGKRHTFESAASDPDGSITGYEWTFGDGTTATGATVEHAYDATGEYSVGLTVTDDDGATDTATTTVTVAEANEPPTAAIDAETTTPTVGEAVAFDGAGSSDPDGSIATYEWTFPAKFGGTETKYGETVTHEFDAAISTEVTLTVTDTGGATDTATVAVDVQRRDDGSTW